MGLKLTDQILEIIKVDMDKLIKQQVYVNDMQFGFMQRHNYSCYFHRETVAQEWYVTNSKKERRKMAYNGKNNINDIDEELNQILKRNLFKVKGKNLEVSSVTVEIKKEKIEIQYGSIINLC